MNEPARITLSLAKRFFGTGKLDEDHQNIVEHIETRQPISRDVTEVGDSLESFGDRTADRVATIGGSWPFIGVFFLFLLAWTGINSVMLSKADAFDPYPYIFLNLMLSMLAAVQAPIIMMSQNRQAEKDRLAASHDYEVNLRSELEILGIQEKLDGLRGEQHELILSRQTEILERLARIESRL